MTRRRSSPEARGGGRLRSGLLVCALIAAVGAAFASAGPSLTLAGTVRGLLADSIGTGDLAAWEKSEVALLACSLDRGDTLLALHTDRRLIPGSNAKLFATGAFLRRYGPDARIATRVLVRGKASRHGQRPEFRLKGEMVLRGSGMPDVVPLLAPGSRGLLDSLAFLLRSGGLSRFEGTLWVDGSLFQSEPYGPGWAIEDVPYSYGAPVNAILANGNAATLVLSRPKPTKGAKPRKGWAPWDASLDPPEVPLSVLLTPVLYVVHDEPLDRKADLVLVRDPGSRLLRVSGRTYGHETEVRRQVSVPEPDSTAGLVLLGAMRRAGIEVKATVRVLQWDYVRPDPQSAPAAAAVARTDGGEPARFADVASDSFRTVLALESPSAADVAGVVNAVSLNAEADALARMLDPSTRGKSRSRARAELLAMLREAGIDPTDVSLVDGSGLSPYNLTTTRALVSWLTALDRDPRIGAAFREGLAKPGSLGTLKNRFGGSGEPSTLRGKTGTLTNVSGISGYLTTADGERLAFAFLSNGNRGSVAEARAAEDRLVGLLARFRRPLAVARPRPIGIPR